MPKTIGKNDCIALYRANNTALSGYQEAYLSNVELAVQNMIGKEEDIAIRFRGSEKKADKLALKEWREMRDALQEHLIENGQKNSWVDYDPNRYVSLIQRYIEKTMSGVQVLPNVMTSSHPNRIIAIARLVKKLVSVHKTRWGKQLPPYERALMPAVITFAMKNDRFGDIFKFISDAENIKWNPQTSAEPYNRAYNKINSEYANSLREVISNQMTSGIPASWTMNGLKIYDEDYLRLRGKKIKDVDGNEVELSSEAVSFISSNPRGGQMVYHIRDDEAEKEYTITDEYIPSPTDVIHYIMNKYMYGFMSDVGEGQARFVRWREDPKEIKLYDETGQVTGTHDDKLTKVFEKIRIRDEYTKRTGQPENALGNREVFNWKAPDGYEYRYVMFKNSDIAQPQVLPHVAYGPEEYSAYIIAHKKPGSKEWESYYGKNATKNRRNIENIRKDNPNLVQDGWYRTEDWKSYGHFISKGKVLTDEPNRESGWDFSNIRDKWMSNQPENLLLNTRIRSKMGDTKGSSVGKTFWETLGALRGLRWEEGQEIHKLNRADEKRIKEFMEGGEKSKLYKLFNKVLEKDNTKKYFQDIENLFNIHSRIWSAPVRNEEGDIVDRAYFTPNTEFSLIEENYSTRIYRDDVSRHQLDLAIAEEESRITPEMPEDQKERIYKSIEDLKMVKERREGTKEGQMSLQEQREQKTNPRLVLAERNVYMKRRTNWTDPSRRRKDERVHADYLSRVFRRIYQNKLMLELVEILERSMTSEDPMHPSMIDWLINRAKIAFTDPTAWGGIGKWDYSYNSIANYLNKKKDEPKHDADSVRKMVLNSKSLFTAALLGATGALTNRTQSINELIRGGWTYYDRAWTLLEGKAGQEWDVNKVNALIDYWGVDDITSFFMEVLLSGGEVGLQDMGFFNPIGSTLQYPTKTFRDWVRFIARDREGWIKKGIPELDKALRVAESKRIERLMNKLKFEKDHKKRLDLLEKEVAYLYGKDPKSSKKLRQIAKTQELFKREENRLLALAERRDVEVLRENFARVLLMEKSGDKVSKEDYQRSTAYLRMMLGDIAENRMKKMVAFKLSWWFGGLGEKLFTFTGGEREMRRHAALMNVLIAFDNGYLGSKDWTDKQLVSTVQEIDGKMVKQEFEIPSALLSDKAVRIARNSVADSMFAMSPTNLSDSMIGFGAQLFLYKAYAMQQMQHDFNILKSWWSGSQTVTERVDRLRNAAAFLVKRAWEAYTSADPKKRQYNPTEKGVDHEAVKVLRLMLYRAGLTVATLLAETIPFVRMMFRSPLMSQFHNIMRGGENPALRIAFRIVVNLAIFASLDDDQFEGNVVDIGWDLARLLFPVFLTMPLYTIYRLVD